MAEIPLDPEVITAVRQAQSLVVLTGAGVSAESGVPTFRDAQTGLWAKYSPTELASPEAFQSQPATVLRWYQWRMELIRQAGPNPGHYSLAELEQLFSRKNKAYLLITQNVDNLHREAGSQQLIELHGNIFQLRCHRCRRPAELDLLQVDLEEGLPRCPACGSLLRPDVVWFGESLPENDLQTCRERSAGCDLFFSIGTSAAVQPAASLPLTAESQGALLVEINPRPTALSPRAEFQIAYPSGEVLPLLVSNL
mgnify:CR=1 FL=1